MVAENHKFSSWLSGFFCVFFGDHSNIPSNLCACEQSIRRQNVFVCWLLNGVRNNLFRSLNVFFFFEEKDDYIEQAYRKKFVTHC